MRAWRRPAALVVVGLAVAGLVMIDRSPPAPATVDLGTFVPPVQPVAGTGPALSTAWFCPGVPADADGSASGTITVLNTGATPLSGTLTVTPIDGQPVSQPLELAARSRITVVPTSIVAASYVAVEVELFGAGAVVEQLIQSRAGTSLSPCASAASDRWYTADGVTTVDAQSALTLYNPFADAAIVDVTFATDEGVRTPQELQGYVVPPRSLRVVDVDEAVRRSRQVSAAVVARSGRLVVGRYQTFRGLRRGLVAGLAAPAAGTSWLFPSGDKGPEVRERVVVYNPGQEDAEVSVTLYPADPASGQVYEPVTVSVPAGATQIVDIAGDDLLAAGRHSIIVGSENGAAVVVERVIDRGTVQGNSGAATTVELGTLLTGGRWFLASSPPPGSRYLVTLANGTGSPTTATLRSITPEGSATVPGFESIALAAAASVELDLTGTPAAASALVVEAGAAIAVDRTVVPPGEGTGATASLGIVEDEG